MKPRILLTLALALGALTACGDENPPPAGSLDAGMDSGLACPFEPGNYRITKWEEVDGKCLLPGFVDVRILPLGELSDALGRNCIQDSVVDPTGCQADAVLQCNKDVRSTNTVFWTSPTTFEAVEGWTFAPSGCATVLLVTGEKL